MPHHRCLRFRAGQGPCHANLHKWCLAQSPSCDCGQRQTMNYIVDTCPLTKFEGGLNLLHEADDDAVIWLGWNVRRLQHSRNNNNHRVRSVLHLVLAMTVWQMVANVYLFWSVYSDLEDYTYPRVSRLLNHFSHGRLAILCVFLVCFNVLLVLTIYQPLLPSPAKPGEEAPHCRPNFDI